MLEEITPEKADHIRTRFGLQATAGEVVEVPASQITRWYQIFENPLTVGILGTPNSSGKIEFRILYEPQAYDAVSSSVNPITPAKYDELLILGTRRYLYIFNGSDECQAALAESYKGRRGVRPSLNQQWQEALTYNQSLSTRERISFPVEEEGLRWI